MVLEHLLCFIYCTRLAAPRILYFECSLNRTLPPIGFKNKSLGRLSRAKDIVFDYFRIQFFFAYFDWKETFCKVAYKTGDAQASCWAGSMWLPCPENILKQPACSVGSFRGVAVPAQVPSGRKVQVSGRREKGEGLKTTMLLNAKKKN